LAPSSSSAYCSIACGWSGADAIHPIFRADRTESTSSMNTQSAGSIYVAHSLPAAFDALNECGSSGAPFAGGTWIMRSPIRHEPHKPHYVAIGKIAELTTIRIDADVVEIGAAVTQAALASAMADLPEFDVLATAAGRCANPAIRAMATIGGNLSTPAFAAADCVPALLCLDAEVEVSSRDDQDRIDLEHFLKLRPTLKPGRLVTRIILPRRDRKTAHARLPLRKSGDYPAAIVSLAVSFDAAARVQTARIAVGSVEPVARRWQRLEAALVGRPLDPSQAAEAAAELAAEFTGRDSVDLPAWYRVSVLPSLVRRAAVAALDA
jgi:carbon-monoxide dehydrogenase medium subunit